MVPSILLRFRGRRLRDVRLYAMDKVVGKARQHLYSKAISNHCPACGSNRLTINTSTRTTESDLKVAKLYIDHVFDMLGSGPQKLSSKKERESNQTWEISNCEIAATKAAIDRINPSFSPIPWEEDFKNEYVFDPKEKSEHIVIRESSGFDIKIPWELARCQHLPFLARLYAQTNDIQYKNEILCEMLDFIAFNPVGYGVNWKCTMDVAIRVSNWIMALDIIQEPLDEETEEILAESIYQHCIFIRYHLEDQRDYRGNHYLSDIVGLLFSSTFFAPDSGMGKIQEFAINRLFASIDEQFYEDGGNFESSLPYHRLSLELALFGLWRILILSEFNPLCKKYADGMSGREPLLRKLGCAMKMMIDAIKPDGNIYQLGDNDSGHLFRFYHFGEFLTPEQYSAKYDRSPGNGQPIWDENELCCEEIVLAIRAILGVVETDSIFDDILGGVFRSAGIVPALSSAFNAAGTDVRLESEAEPFDEGRLPYRRTNTIVFDTPINLDTLRPFYYPDFGLAGIIGKGFYLGVCLTGVGQKGRGGHSHNDKLSYELFANGVDYQRDPGTYVYTQSLEWRNRFRSVLAHNSPYFGEEQNMIGENCFELRQRTDCRLSRLTNRAILCSCDYSSIHVVREFALSEDRISIKDNSNAEFIVSPVFEFFSNGYGKLIKHRRRNEL